MPLSPEFMRAFLFVGLAGMALLAACYLRRRSLSLSEYVGWGFLILALPLLGPFLVILTRAGAGQSLAARRMRRQRRRMDRRNGAGRIEAEEASGQ